MATLVHLDDLKPQDALSGGILSEHGIRLLDAGEQLTDAVIGKLREFGFERVYITNSESEEESIIRFARYQRKAIAELGEDEPVAVAIYDQNDRLLVEAGQPIPKDQRNILLRQGVLDVAVDKPLPADTEMKLGRFFMQLSDLRRHTRILKGRIKETPVETLPEARMLADPSALTLTAVEQAAEAGNFDDQPGGEPLSALILPIDPTQIRPLGKVREMIQVHESVLRNAEQIFAQIRANTQVDGALIAALATQVVTNLINDPALVLNLSGIKNSSYFIVSHSINTCLISVSIGAAMGYSAEQVTEMAYGALLHDCGMMRVPAHLPFKKAPLTPVERLEIEKHPIHGINVLQTISRLPRSAPLVVYQENERIDGSGYPKRRGPALIHNYAKIVAVAATFEALCFDRPHRKAMHPYRAMEHILQQVGRRKFDAAAARALLKVMSLFPIGCWVRLNDGTSGRVVGSNVADYTRPVVSVVLDKHGAKLPQPVPLDLSHSDNRDLKIEAPLDPPKEFENDLRTAGFVAFSQ